MSTPGTPSMSIVLAADTSSRINTVALCQHGNVLAEASIDAHRLHAERLIGIVDWLLHEAGLALAEVDLLAVAAGPGSFTGLRIGVSTWKGLAFGAKKPLIGVSTLDALSRQVPLHEGLLCPLLDARMREVFGVAYLCQGPHRDKVLADRVGPVESLISDLPDQSGPVVFFGDGAQVYRERILQASPNAIILDPPLGIPRASFVAAEALAQMAQGAQADGAALSPVYLRQSQAEQLRAAKTAEIA